MKSFVILLVSILLSGGPSLQEVRNAFQEAEKSKEGAESFNTLIQKDISIDRHLKMAYFGASETLIAKHGGSIQTRVRLFNSGKAHIENAVAANPSNLEIRLVRLMIQYNAPAILGYRSNIEMDKNFIIKNFQKAAPDLKKYIRDIARDTNVFEPEERALLK